MQIGNKDQEVDDPENVGAVDQWTATYTSSVFDKNFKACNGTAMMLLGNKILCTMVIRLRRIARAVLICSDCLPRRLYHTKRQPRHLRRQRVADTTKRMPRAIIKVRRNGCISFTWLVSPHTLTAIKSTVAPTISWKNCSCATGGDGIELVQSTG
jgi:hypothetical protein